MRTDGLRQLEHGIAELEKYIEYNAACNKIISDSEGIDNLVPESISTLLEISTDFRRKKIFEYNSYIISLYGLFERFLENILEDYLKDICSILKSYHKLPADLRKNLLSSNIDVLRNLTNPKFNSISASEFVRKLNEALSEDRAVLNVEAFQHHPYNFKQTIVAEYFGKIGVSGISGSLKAYEPLRTILEQKYGNPSPLQSDIVFKVIDDLSQRRNDVAHGVENVEILNITIIKEYTEYLLAYCRSLFNILENERNSYLFNETASNFVLISVVNNSVVCGSVEAISFSISDHLITEKPEGNFPRYEQLNITDIQINNISHYQLIVIDKTDIGINVSGYIKENYKFKIITVLNTGIA